MNIIAETEFGSHLYGLNTLTSDRDYKGVILPTKTEVLLGTAKYHVDRSTNTSAVKNSSTDVDSTYYSLQYFIELASKGETVAIDMLHGSADKLTQTSDIWKYLVDNRSMFYTKSMKSYIGYVRKQAAKYGIKGSRVGDAEKMLNFLSQYSSDNLVGNLCFPESEFGLWVDYKGNRYYEFAGSKFQDNLKISYMYDVVKKMYDNYGERSKLAKENKGVDFKAVSHALRAGYQARAIFKYGTFSYPLAETEFLLKVKNGSLDFLTEIEPELDALVKEVTALSEQSNFPEKVDQQFWNEFICNIHLDIINELL